MTSKQKPMTAEKPSSFLQVCNTLRDGHNLDELDAHLTRICEAVALYEQAGSLTYTIIITPVKNTSHVVMLEDDIKYKLPQPEYDPVGFRVRHGHIEPMQHGQQSDMIESENYDGSPAMDVEREQDNTTVTIQMPDGRTTGPLPFGKFKASAQKKPAGGYCCAFCGQVRSEADDIYCGDNPDFMCCSHTCLEAIQSRAKSYMQHYSSTARKKAVTACTYCHGEIPKGSHCYLDGDNLEYCCLTHLHDANEQAEESLNGGGNGTN